MKRNVRTRRLVGDRARRVIGRCAARVGGTRAAADPGLEGELKGKRDVLLRLVARAGIALSDGERSRILACEDGATLDRWAENVLRAKTAADVLV
ncbi:hypothetical protein WME90_32015 [Sorangium sp. So ce375]|uniref:hypothetical protein n=1 Tax=Sorangium sp. So ce375 TaxID=3133306 RepID=UPI003F5C72EB